MVWSYDYCICRLLILIMKLNSELRLLASTPKGMAGHYIEVGGLTRVVLQFLLWKKNLGSCQVALQGKKPAGATMCHLDAEESDLVYVRLPAATQLVTRTICRADQLPPLLQLVVQGPEPLDKSWRGRVLGCIETPMRAPTYPLTRSCRNTFGKLRSLSGANKGAPTGTG